MPNYGESGRNTSVFLNVVSFRTICTSQGSSTDPFVENRELRLDISKLSTAFEMPVDWNLSNGPLRESDLTDESRHNIGGSYRTYSDYEL